MEKSLPELLEGQIDQEKASRIKQYPVHSNRASQIGHPCLRYLVFERTRWGDKIMHEVGLQYIFDEGNEQEKIVIKTLMDAGFEIAEQQRSFQEKKENITGHIDLIMSHPEVMKDQRPTEIKSISPFSFTAINTYKDIVNSKHHYVRNYAAQLQMYLYMTEYENGLFIFKNKTSGRMKFILATIDYDLIDSLFKRAKEVNKISAQEKIDYPSLECTDDSSICQGCGYRHICFKDKEFGPGIQVVDDVEAEEKIRRIKELEPSVSEHKELVSSVGDNFKAKAAETDDKKVQYLVGGYMIEISKQTQNRLDTKAIPLDVREKYTKEINIVKLNKIIEV